MKAVGKINTSIGSTLGIPCGKTAFAIGASCCMALAVAWTVVIAMPWGWHTANSFVWDFDVSLYSFGTERNEDALKAQQRHPVTLLSQLFDTLTQRDTMVWISVAKWEFCRRDVSPEWCEYFHRLQLGSWVMMTAGIVGVCCLLMGVLAGFHFHYIKQRDDLQRWATAYLVTAPLLFQIGIWTYYYLTWDFDDLVSGPAASSTRTFGWMFYISLVLGSLTWIASWFFTSFTFRDSYDEDSGSGEEDGLWIDMDAEAGYGAMMNKFRQTIKDTTAPFFTGSDESDGQEGTADAPQANIQSEAEAEQPPVATANGAQDELVDSY